MISDHEDDQHTIDPLHSMADRIVISDQEDDQYTIDPLHSMADRIVISDHEDDQHTIDPLHSIADRISRLHYMALRWLVNRLIEFGYHGKREHKCSIMILSYSLNYVHVYYCVHPILCLMCLNVLYLAYAYFIIVLIDN